MHHQTNNKKQNENKQLTGQYLFPCCYDNKNFNNNSNLHNGVLKKGKTFIKLTLNSPSTSGYLSFEKTYEMVKEIKASSVQIKAKCIQIKANSKQIKNNPLQIKANSKEIKTNYIEIKADSKQIKASCIQLKANSKQLKGQNKYQTDKYDFLQSLRKYNPNPQNEKAFPLQLTRTDYKQKSQVLMNNEHQQGDNKLSNLLQNISNEMFVSTQIKHRIQCTSRQLKSISEVRSDMQISYKTISNLENYSHMEEELSEDQQY